jgi:transposase
MLARGASLAEVARICEVSRQTAMPWARMLTKDPQAWRRRPLGRPGVFGPKERTRLSKLLLQGAVANGFAAELWTPSRVAKLIEREFGHAFCISYVWTLLPEMGFSSQRPVGRASQRDEQAILQRKAKRWPAPKTDARQDGRTIVFVEESGLSERPTRVKTWAPKGLPRCCNTASTGNSSG